MSYKNIQSIKRDIENSISTLYANLEENTEMIMNDFLDTVFQKLPANNFMHILNCEDTQYDNVVVFVDPKKYYCIPRNTLRHIMEEFTNYDASETYPPVYVTDKDYEEEGPYPLPLLNIKGEDEFPPDFIPIPSTELVMSLYTNHILNILFTDKTLRDTPLFFIQKSDGNWEFLGHLSTTERKIYSLKNSFIEFKEFLQKENLRLLLEKNLEYDIETAEEIRKKIEEENRKKEEEKKRKEEGKSKEVKIIPIDERILTLIFEQKKIVFKPLKNSFIRNYGEDILNYIANIRNIDSQSIVIEKVVGKGSYGAVYMLNLNNEQNIILKIEELRNRTNEQLLREYENQVIFHNLGMGAPEPYFRHCFVFEETTYCAIAMKLDPYAVEFGMFSTHLENENISTYMLDAMVQSVEFFITKMCDNDLVHGDLHLGNIGFQVAENIEEKEDIPTFNIMVRGKEYILSPMMIDFGFSNVNRRCVPLIEIIQILKSLYSVRIAQTNKEYLYTIFRAMIQPDEQFNHIINQIPEVPLWNMNELRFLRNAYFTVFTESGLVM